MAESEYKVLKTRIEELIENIESIDKETASFSAAKAKLIEVADNLQEISSDLSKAIKTSETVLNQVESIAVTSTLQSMKESADKYTENCENLLQKSKTLYSEHAQEIKNKLDSLSAELRKKIVIMGGISIFVSIVALICAII